MKGGGTPEDWKPARTRQVDRDGRWTLKRGRKRPAPPEGGAARTMTGAILVPSFGYKNHVSIDRLHGLIRRFAVTHAFGVALGPVAADPSPHDGGRLGAVLDPANTARQAWAGEPVSATGPSETGERLPVEGQPRPSRAPRPRGRAAAAEAPRPADADAHPPRQCRARRCPLRRRAARKSRTKLIIRTIGIARARAKLALAGIACNLTRLARLERGTAPV